MSTRLRAIVNARCEQCSAHQPSNNAPPPSITRHNRLTTAPPPRASTRRSPNHAHADDLDATPTRIFPTSTKEPARMAGPTPEPTPEAWCCDRPHAPCRPPTTEAAPNTGAAWPHPGSGCALRNAHVRPCTTAPGSASHARRSQAARRCRGHRSRRCRGACPP